MVCQHLDRTHYNYCTEHLKFKIGSLSDLMTTYTIQALTWFTILQTCTALMTKVLLILYSIFKSILRQYYFKIGDHYYLLVIHHIQ